MSPLLVLIGALAPLAPQDTAQDPAPDPSQETASAQAGSTEAGSTEAGSTEAGPTGAASTEVGPLDPIAELDRLAAAHPELLRRHTTTGRSRHGRPLVVFVLHDPAAGEEGAKPGVWLDGATSLLVEDGARAVVDWTRHVIEERERDPGAARVLATTTCYVMPVPAPDELARAQGTHDPAVEVGPAGRYEANWPGTWYPNRAAFGEGPYALAFPETRFVANFLYDHPHVGLALSAHADRARSHGDPCLRWAAEQLDLATRALVLRPEAPDRDRGRLVREATERILGVPDVTLGEPVIRELGEGLWTVEVALEAAPGSDPVYSALRHERRLGRAPTLTLTGDLEVLAGGLVLDPSDPTRVALEPRHPHQVRLRAGLAPGAVARWYVRGEGDFRVEGRFERARDRAVTGSLP